MFIKEFKTVKIHFDTATNRFFCPIGDGTIYADSVPSLEEKIIKHLSKTLTPVPIYYREHAGSVINGNVTSFAPDKYGARFRCSIEGTSSYKGVTYLFPITDKNGGLVSEINLLSDQIADLQAKREAVWSMMDTYSEKELAKELGYEYGEE